MERCKLSVNVIKLSHLFTIWPPLPRPPSTLCPLSLLLSGPLYHSFKIVVALKPLANVSMSLFRAGQWPASQLPPGCSLIDGPPLGEWQPALVGPRRPLWQLVLLAGVSQCRTSVGGCWAPRISQLEPWPSLLEPGQSGLPGVLVVADQLVSSLFPHTSCSFLCTYAEHEETGCPECCHEGYFWVWQSKIQNHGFFLFNVEQFSSINMVL